MGGNEVALASNMFEKKTVLILGAGASCPYGFPTANELRKEILGIFESGLFNEFLQATASISVNRDSLRHFTESFRHSGRYSIDAFLEHRQDFAEIGKSLISFVVGKHEIPDTLFNAKDESDDWYRALFNKICPDMASFKKNALSIVTFNYDRSLEQYFQASLVHSFGIGIAEANSMISEHLGICHVYGSIGMHPAVGCGGPLTVPYSAGWSPEILARSNQSIRLSRDGDFPMESFSPAFDMISNADIICFLGFSFEKSNLDRLLLGKLPNGKRILGSSFGMTDAERKRVSDSIRIKFEFPREKTLGYLRNMEEFQ